MAKSGESGINRYRAHEWERKTVVFTGVFIVAAIIYLVIRNEPFKDQNLVVLVRIILALAVALCGATIPGFLNVEWNLKGMFIRSGGALALFVLTLSFTPKVLPALDNDRAELISLRLKSVTDKFETSLAKLASRLDQIDDKQALKEIKSRFDQLQNDWNLSKSKFSDRSIAEQEQALSQMEKTAHDMADLVTTPVIKQPTSVVNTNQPPPLINQTPPPNPIVDTVPTNFVASNSQLASNNVTSSSRPRPPVFINRPPNTNQTSELAPPTNLRVIPPTN